MEERSMGFWRQGPLWQTGCGRRGNEEPKGGPHSLWLGVHRKGVTGERSQDLGRGIEHPSSWAQLSWRCLRETQSGYQVASWKCDSRAGGGRGHCWKYKLWKRQHMGNV